MLSTKATQHIYLGNSSDLIYATQSIENSPGSHNFNSYGIVSVMVCENSMLDLVFARINHSFF